MENTASEPTTAKGLKAQFLSAIEADNLQALQALVQLHGTEVQLFRAHVKKDWMQNEISCSLDGTPLSIAALLKKETLAVYLVRAGAKQVAASNYQSGWFGWASATMMPIEAATTFNMRKLALALMQAEPSVDWSFCANIDEDGQSSSSTEPSLFELLTENNTQVRALEDFGLFQGRVNGIPVKVSANAGVFEVFLDGLLIGNNLSMQGGIDLLRAHLGKNAPNPA